MDVGLGFVYLFVGVIIVHAFWIINFEYYSVMVEVCKFSVLNSHPIVVVGWLQAECFSDSKWGMHGLARVSSGVFYVSSVLFLTC